MKRIYNGVEVEYQNETDYNQSNVVYLITFPDGKYYVGSTTGQMSHRVCDHCVNAITCNKQLLISSAIREFMKFEVKILGTRKIKQDLRELEGVYTSEYKSNERGFGYNFDCGCVKKFTDEIKIKMSESKKGKAKTDETRAKISESKGIHLFFDDSNNQFRSLNHAAEYYKCSPTCIGNLLKSGKTSKKLGTGFYYEPN